jgi:hypothetical protein
LPVLKYFTKLYTTKTISLLLLGAAILLPLRLLAETPATQAVNPVGDLTQGFIKPPHEARPAVLWDWMGGLLSKEGITKDLEALAAQGFGRVMIMQMPDQPPYPRQWAFQDYPGKIKCLSDGWFDMMNFAVGECDRLGMQLGVFICPGWGHVGGPWVPADKGTKKLTMTGVSIKEPVRFDKVLPKKPPHPIASAGNDLPAWNKDHALLPKPRENFFRDEAVLALPGGDAPVDPSKIIDLSDKVGAEGRLTWDVPAGDWKILRVSLISENGVNHPAPPESLGLETDRMDPEPVRLVYEGMVGRIRREALAKGYKSFFAFETDSYETGFQDYGVDFREQFKKRRGYDCVPWLPAWLDKKTIIGSPELTARFKHDMSRTISDLWAERFQGTLRKLADENGLQWMTEPYWNIPLDWTRMGGLSHMVGEEFWVSGMQVGNAAEIAGTYGQQIVWAEAFTAEAQDSAWRNHPWTLKSLGDKAFARGVNLFFIHGFVHNPFADDYQPGLSFGYWGTQFSRHLTWWPLARAWSDYLARCQFLLQQGRPTFDVLQYPSGYHPVPRALNGTYRMARLTDEVLEKLTVRDGKLVLPHGAEFRALTLSGEPVRPEALEKIRDLVRDGAVLIANPPAPVSASLENYPASDERMARLIKEIWAVEPGSPAAPGERKLGKGTVIGEGKLDEGMAKLGMLPDFVVQPAAGAKRPNVVTHLRIANGIKYWFVSNQGDADVKFNANFDVSGRQPQWWDPVLGAARNLPEFRFENGRTVVPLELAPRQSGFVLFADPVAAPEKTGVNFAQLTTVAEINTIWKVSFNPRWGGPKDPVEFAKLEDWSKHPDEGIKYYSGIANYKTSFDAVPSQKPQYIDIGKVHDIARVRLNGKDLGIVWCAPWRVQVPPAVLLEKNNTLEIEVANSWANRLIGDEQQPDDFITEPGNATGSRLGGYATGVKARGLKELPEWLLNRQPRPSSKRLTFSSWFFYDSVALLQPSGLLGPVTLQSINVVP